MHINERLESLRRQLQYVNSILDCELQNWERKEYTELKHTYMEEIVALEMLAEPLDTNYMVYDVTFAYDNIEIEAAFINAPIRAIGLN